MAYRDLNYRSSFKHFRMLKFSLIKPALHSGSITVSFLHSRNYTVTLHKGLRFLSKGNKIIEPWESQASCMRYNQRCYRDFVGTLYRLWYNYISYRRMKSPRREHWLVKYYCEAVKIIGGQIVDVQLS